ncbi:TPA: DNA repair protein [Pasteurella multocida]|nr:DNA repair protein [Pasteurella multocida]
MQTRICNSNFDWNQEINKTIIQSLVTSFGIDFLLLEDKRGGDVDTIHNVRNGVWATDKEKKAYDNRGEYDSHAYHSHPQYTAINREHSEKKMNSTLIDGYTGNQVKPNDDIDLDHVISAKTIHDDPGRVLAEIEGADLANRKENLVSTSSSINRSKKADSIEDFVKKIPQKIENKQREIEKYKNDISKLNPNVPVDKQKLEGLNKKIKNAEEYIEKHKNIDVELAKKKSEKAKKEQNKEINQKYYTSSKFFKNAAISAGKQGIKMGTRQVVGVILAEVWFEIKEVIPTIYLQCKKNFTFEKFLYDIKTSLINIFQSIKYRFKELLNEFKNGVIGGIISSVNTTILNIFFTTEKIIIKLLRELWVSLIKALKLLIFNPDKLSLDDLCKEISKVLATGIAVALGAILHQYLSSLFIFPLGEEIAAFVSAVVSGIMTLASLYFLEHSSIMNKVWDKLNSLQNKLKTQFELDLEYYKKINIELDCYLIEL